MIETILAKMMKRLALLPASTGVRPRELHKTLRFETCERRDLLTVFTVNATTDPAQFDPNDAVVSLREAVARSNAQLNVGGPDVIRFDPAVFNAGTGATISLSQGQLPGITDAVMIEAADTAGVPLTKPVTISGSNASRIFETLNTTVTIDGKTAGFKIINGKAPTTGGSSGFGGAIYANNSILTVRKTEFRNNVAALPSGTTPNNPDEYSGGAIYATLGAQLPTGGAYAQLVIDNCLFEENAASQRGGAVAVTEGPGNAAVDAAIDLWIRDSSFGGNIAGTDGGGLYVGRGARGTAINQGVDAVVERTNFIGNSAGLDGGGVAWIDVSAGFDSQIGPPQAGKVRFTESAFRGNYAGASGGGLLYFSLLELTASPGNPIVKGSILVERCEFSGLNEAKGGVLTTIEGDTNHFSDSLTKTGILWSSSTHSSAPGATGGGGLAIVEAGRPGQLDAQIVNTTISGNKGRNGGGALLQGNVRVDHSTIAYNQLGTDPGPQRSLHARGGGVLLAGVQGTNAVGLEAIYGLGVRRKVAEFRNTIVALNTGVNSPDIGFVYEDGFTDDFEVLHDFNRVNTPPPPDSFASGQTIKLDKIRFDQAWYPANWNAGGTDIPAVWPRNIQGVGTPQNIINEYLVSDFVFANSFLGSRSGALEDGDGNPATGRWANFATSTYRILTTAELANLLDPVLKANGGPTLTHALPTASVAINGGSTTAIPPTDQRGTGFPRLVGPAVDVGAYERMAATLQVTNVTLKSSTAGANGQTALQPDFLFNGANDATDFDGSGIQLRTAPLANIDTVRIDFSAPLQNIAADSLKVIGLRYGATVTLVSGGFSFTPGSSFAIWKFQTAGSSGPQAYLPSDEYLISLSDTVTGAGATPLDGDWRNPKQVYNTYNMPSSGYYADSQISVFPSGNGDAGGNFNFVFTVIRSDVNLDNSVDQADISIIVAHQNNIGGFTWGDVNATGTVNNADYNIVLAEYLYVSFRYLMFADFDGNGIVDFLDYKRWKDHFGQTGATFADGDADRNTSINGSDLLIIQRQLGLRITMV